MGRRRKRQKPYRPLHLPPEALPPGRQRGLFGGQLTRQEHALEEACYDLAADGCGAVDRGPDSCAGDLVASGVSHK